jgi:hypothetical protein
LTGCERKRRNGQRDRLRIKVHKEVVQEFERMKEELDSEAENLRAPKGLRGIAGN